MLVCNFEIVGLVSQRNRRVEPESTKNRSFRLEVRTGLELRTLGFQHQFPEPHDSPASPTPQRMRRNQDSKPPVSCNHTYLETASRVELRHNTNVWRINGGSNEV